MAGLDCFKKVFIWRVGDGTHINIWEDNWIPSSHNLKIMTPRGSNILTRVSDLINPIDGSWDEDLIGDGQLMHIEFCKFHLHQIGRTLWRGTITSWGCSLFDQLITVSGIISSGDITGMLIYRRVLIIQFGGNCGTWRFLAK
jgi:hypothetical protein